MIYILQQRDDSHFSRITNLGGLTEIIWGPGSQKDAEEWIALKGMEFTHWADGNIIGFSTEGEDWDSKIYWMVNYEKKTGKVFNYQTRLQVLAILMKDVIEKKTPEAEERFLEALHQHQEINRGH